MYIVYLVQKFLNLLTIDILGQISFFVLEVVLCNVKFKAASLAFTH